MARGHIAELTGQRFGRLVVEERSENDAGGRATWKCRCDCGESCVVKAHNLARGSTRSCGCYRRETSAARSRTHGQTRTPTHTSWSSMWGRCSNPADPAWKYYGARGISVCARWVSFENFLADMGERPEGKTLDRWPNNDGNYEPGNCRWATPAEQNANRRRAA